MYKKELDTRINSGDLPRVLMLYGEAFYSDYYAKKILSIWGKSENILSFYFDEYNYESAKNFIAQPSLFGDANILYIRSDKKFPKKELENLVSFCKKNSNSFFLLHFSGDDRVAKELSKSFGKRKGGDFVRFFKPNMGEAVTLMRHKANKLELDIENFALSHLFMLQNEDLALCMKELEKLSLLNKTITVSDIDTFVFAMGTLSLDDFINELLNKKDIKKELFKLTQSGTFDEIRILNTITGYITQLMLFHIYIKVNGKYDVLDILGYALPPVLVKQRAALSIKFRLNTYKKLLEHLLKCEHRLKYSHHIDKNSYLISCLIKLQSYL